MTGPPCHDCAVAVGQPHDDGCDVARCLWTGLQRIACDESLVALAIRILRSVGHNDTADRLAYHYSVSPADEAHDCGNETWTGEWPGAADARRLGWWCYFRPDFGEGNGWARCAPDHPGASEDLNRLQSSGRWNRELQRWEDPTREARQ